MLSIKRILANLAVAALLCVSATTLAQAPPSLGQAGSFSILGGSAISNTGSSVVTGDLGIWPNTASSITGFPPGVVVGTVHAGDAVAQQAQSDLTTAYNDLAGRSCGTTLTGTDLGGLTLTPGVYCFTSVAQLTGTLTLDAQGNANAVFIFQIGTSLNTASGARVLVINGGSNCNVFWQVGSSATLGTATTFAGTVLALTSITLTTGASVSGRVLARNGAVTLDTNNAALCSVGCPAIILAPASLPNGGVGMAYSQTLTASGGTAPYSFNVVSGALPPGLTLTPSGVLAGVPSTSGSFTFTVTATDANGCAGSQTYMIVINATMCTTITVSPTSLPAANVGVAYNQTLTASGGTAPYTFIVVSGALPPGLTLSPTGMLTGTPSSAGNFVFTVRATDAAGCVGFRTYSFAAVAASQPVPSLSQWGLLILSLLLVVAVVLRQRRGS